MKLVANTIPCSIQHGMDTYLSGPTAKRSSSPGDTVAWGSIEYGAPPHAGLINMRHIEDRGVSYETQMQAMRKGMGVHREKDIPGLYILPGLQEQCKVPSRTLIFFRVRAVVRWETS